MSGREAGRIFRGPTSRAIALAVRRVIGQHTAPATAVASCPKCTGPLRFSTNTMTGRTHEHCDRCGHSAPVVRRLGEALLELQVPLVENPRACARCGAQLPNGKMGTRRPRFCRDRRACLRASEGRTVTPAPAKLDDRLVLEKLSRSQAEARRLQDVAAEFSDFTTEQVRRVLVRLVHRGQARTTMPPLPRPQGGRPPLRYWRAA